MLPSPKNRCEPWHALRGSSVASRRIVPPASAFGSGRGSCERPARAPTVTGTLKRPPGQQGHRQSPRLRLRIWERRSASERRLEQSAFTGSLPTSSNIFQPGHQSFLLAIARMVVSCCEALDLRCSHWIVWTATVRSLLWFVCYTKCFQLSHGNQIAWPRLLSGPNPYLREHIRVWVPMSWRAFATPVAAPQKAAASLAMQHVLRLFGHSSCEPRINIGSGARDSGHRRALLHQLHPGLPQQGAHRYIHNYTWACPVWAAVLRLRWWTTRRTSPTLAWCYILRNGITIFGSSWT